MGQSGRTRPSATGMASRGINDDERQLNLTSFCEKTTADQHVMATAATTTF
jgi:hypothetical protein